MTCIVGITNGKNVWMGGDSFGGNDFHMQKVRDPKVFELKVEVLGESEHEPMLIGGCGSFRMLNVLEYSLDIPSFDRRLEVRHWMVEFFAEQVRTSFKKKGLLQTHHETEESVYGAFLVGFLGELYTLQQDFAVIAWAEKEHATGAGEEYALGSLYATRGRIKTPSKRVELALEAAVEFSPCVLPPFTILSTE
jgi:hypothetical protein